MEERFWALKHGARAIFVYARGATKLALPEELRLQPRNTYVGVVFGWLHAGNLHKWMYINFGRSAFGWMVLL
jgi:hypothetical protein